MRHHRSEGRIDAHAAEASVDQQRAAGSYKDISDVQRAKVTYRVRETQLCFEPAVLARISRHDVQRNARPSSRLRTSEARNSPNVGNLGRAEDYSTPRQHSVGLDASDCVEAEQSNST